MRKKRVEESVMRGVLGAFYFISNDQSNYFERNKLK